MNLMEIVQFLIRNWDKVVKPFLSLLNLPTSLSDLKQLFIKGDNKNMNNQLCYEKMNVSAATDIEKAYKEVVANNKKYYRCKTATGKIIGWHVPSNRFISAEKAEELYPDMIYKEGDQVWFINGEYKEVTDIEPISEPIPVLASEPIEEPIVASVAEEPVKPVEEPKETAKVVEPTKAEQPNIAPIEDIKKNVEETTAVFADMINKYNEACKQLAEERRKLAEKDEIIADLQGRVKVAEKRVEELSDDEENAIDKLDELREAVSTFIKFLKGVNNER